MKASMVILVLQIFDAFGTLTPNSPKAKSRSTRADILPTGSQNYSVWEKKLVSSQPKAQEIIENCHAYSSDTQKRHVPGIVLGYITPWNSEGYNIAKIFANKFTHISPVWLQVRPDGTGRYDLTGTHDIDVGWMEAVRANGEESKVRIVPRVLFEHWSLQQLLTLLSQDKEIDILANVFLRSARKWQLDGYVIELWSLLAGRIQDDLLVSFVKKLAKKLMAKNHLDFFLAVPPIGKGEAGFSKENYAELKDFVSGFSLMTYDYSNVHRPGPNAPITWIEHCIRYLSETDERREKILTGLNFYGMEFMPSGGGPIINDEYIKKLAKFAGKLQYDSQSEEHFFEIREKDGKHVIFYPTLHSINRRLDLVRDLNTGVSIWELGQGLPYFYDLF